MRASAVFALVGERPSLVSRSLPVSPNLSPSMYAYLITCTYMIYILISLYIYKHTYS